MSTRIIFSGLFGRFCRGPARPDSSHLGVWTGQFLLYLGISRNMRPVDKKKKRIVGYFKWEAFVYVLAESKCCFYTPGIVHDVFTFDV
jgi:hypothetical protein